MNDHFQYQIGLIDDQEWVSNKADVGLPTATEDVLGSGKYTAGPSALGVYMGPKWKLGGLVTHFKDFADLASIIIAGGKCDYGR